MSSIDAPAENSSALPQKLRRPADKLRMDDTGMLLGRGAALVPARSIAGRSLTTVIAIMTFLAAIAAGAAQIVASASSEWKSSIAREATIQIRPRPGRDIEADIAQAAAIARETAGIAEVQAYSRREAERLLEPWLGQGLDFAELPVPRVIVVRIGDGGADLAALGQKISAAIPGASLDDHRLWVGRLATMANAVVIVAVALVVLVLVATALAVVFATRSAVSANRDIVEVLHFIGAEDRYIGQEFARHFLKLGLQGGLSGGVSAILCLWFAGVIGARFQATPGGDQVEALFGSFALGWAGFFLIILLALLVAGLTTYVCWQTVARHLARLS